MSWLCDLLLQRKSIKSGPDLLPRWGPASLSDGVTCCFVLQPLQSTDYAPTHTALRYKNCECADRLFLSFSQFTGASLSDNCSVLIWPTHLSLPCFLNPFSPTNAIRFSFLFPTGPFRISLTAPTPCYFRYLCLYALLSSSSGRLVASHKCKPWPNPSKSQIATTQKSPAWCVQAAARRGTPSTSPILTTRSSWGSPLSTSMCTRKQWGGRPWGPLSQRFSWITTLSQGGWGPARRMGRSWKWTATGRGHFWRRAMWISRWRSFWKGLEGPTGPGGSSCTRSKHRASWLFLRLSFRWVLRRSPTTSLLFLLLHRRWILRSSSLV